MTLDEFVGRLDGAKRAAGGFVARCPVPAHEDRNASLSVSEGDKGIVVKCHANCSTEDVVKSMGLELKDLFYEDLSKPEIVETYDYVDLEGNLLYQGVRMFPKDFRQRRPDGTGGWIWNLQDTERVPYGLPELVEAIQAPRKVFIVEGEKDVKAVRRAGGAATCNPMGAGKWPIGWGEKYFKGAHVVIVVDNDEAGRAHAKTVKADLEGHAASIATVVSKTGGAKHDASDHFAAGWSKEEFVPISLEEVVDGITLVNAHQVEPADADWIIGFENMLPYGALATLTGEPGTNKSTLSSLAAANVSQNHGVMFISTEDDPGITMRPRLEAAGANLDNVHFVSKRENGFDGLVIVPDDVPDLEAAVERTGTRLMVLDPISAHLNGDVDGHKDQSIRTALAPLAKMAQRTKCSILLISHLNKDRSSNPFRRAGGSIGLTGIARSCLLMALDPDDREGLRIVASFKNSLGPIPKSKVYRLETTVTHGRDDQTIRLSEFGYSWRLAHNLLWEKKSRDGE